MTRKITYSEEAVLRLCHHDHWGMGVDDVADIMRITRRAVQTHLLSLKKKVPHLFPILTPRHRAIIELYDQGSFELRKKKGADDPEYYWKHTSRKAVAAALNISAAVLGDEVMFLRKHGFLWNRTMDQFDPSMDGQVKEKF